MADVIQLLPDAVANQIAAGEVIQRPASVVKELMENALDAGATQIQLVLKEAGKQLIQVVDDGCGMSETDARLSFERHATSKIRQAKDLFEIKTMGFRGEAMASIAAIAQVEMRTRRTIDELGTMIQIEGSTVKSQESCQSPVGTNTAVKNLFFNVPARRNFLKANAVELKHAQEEFIRLAIAHPDVFMSLHHNGNELFHLPISNQRQRVVAVLGAQSNQKLVPVLEETDIVRLEGFIGKPEFAKKTRGDQYFFVNRRFIKSGYLHHAIMGAYEDILAKESFPMYVIFLELDPAQIDINVHPTKQEIKFEDERLIYNYLKVAVRHALGKHNITPTLDFEQDNSFNQYGPNAGAEQSNIQRDYGASKGSSYGNNFGNSIPNQPKGNKDWEKLYEGLKEFNPPAGNESGQSLTIASSITGSSSELLSSEEKEIRRPYQIHVTYIVSQIKSGFLLIDQQAAHERILYERYLRQMDNQRPGTQVALFAKTIQVNPADANTLREILPMINQLGFDLQEFGQDTFVLQGTPADFDQKLDEQKVIEQLLEQFKSNLEIQLGVQENLARSMARSTAIKRGQKLTGEEMEELIDQLFACNLPYKSPTGRKCFVTYELEDLEKRFKA